MNLTSRKYTSSALSTRPSAALNATTRAAAGTRSRRRGVIGSPNSGTATITTATEIASVTRFEITGTRARTARGNHTLSVSVAASTIDVVEAVIAIDAYAHAAMPASTYTAQL